MIAGGHRRPGNGGGEGEGWKRKGGRKGECGGERTYEVLFKI